MTIQLKTLSGVCIELGTQFKYSFPRYSHANGQVEVTNKSLLRIIKKKLTGKKGDWAEELLGVLWEY